MLVNNIDNMVEQQNKELIEKILSPLNDDENMSYDIFTAFGNVEIMCENVETIVAVQNLLKIENNFEELKKISCDVCVIYHKTLKK